jgi:predicted ferric reductase
MTTSPTIQSPEHVPLPQFTSRLLGPTTIWVLAIAQAVLWTVARPHGEPVGRYIGQLLGGEAVLLMSIGLVLISSLPTVERWFDGIDHAAIWHRRVMITGMVLLLPHVGLASNPQPSAIGPALAALGMVGLVALVIWAILPRWRSVVPGPLRRAVSAIRDRWPARTVRRFLGGYGRWRALHRTTGLFLAAGFAHGLLDGTAFHSPVLRWSYVAVGGIGLAFYAYRELLARHFVPMHDYQVDAVRRISTGLVEIALRPLGRRLDFIPGQFALVYLEGKDGWHRHPFTISSAPDEAVVRVILKALGDFTSSIETLIEPGMPAVIGGAHGRFDHRRGTQRQVWIAAGVGVTPFLSWLRSAAPGDLAERVDFFYSVAGPAPFGDELRAIAERHDSLHLHLVDTSVDGRLTPEQVLQAADSEPQRLSVFMCGPSAMLGAFQTQLRTDGVGPAHIHREHFDLR